MMRVLVVEDERKVLRNLVRGLQSEGYEAVGAATGEEGLELAVTGFYGVPEAEYARSMGAGRGRNPDPIPAFVSTTPKFYRTF